MYLHITIDPATALAEGHGRSGAQRVALDPATLTPEQRALLGRYTRPRSTVSDGDLELRGLTVQGRNTYTPKPRDATIEAVLSACEACEALRTVDDEETAKEHGLKIDALVAKIDAALWDTPYLDRLNDEPRVQAALERLAERRRAPLEEAIADILTYPVDSWIYAGARCIGTYDRLGVPEGDAREKYLHMRQGLCLDPRLKEYAQAVSAFQERKRDAAERAEAEAKEARERQRLEQIATCVRDWGDDSQRARLAEGLLSETESLEMIAAHVLAPIEADAYQRIDWDDLDHDEDCRCQDIQCRTRTAESLDRDAYASLVSIREAATQAAQGVGGDLVIEARAHACECERCPGGLTRYGALVRISWGVLSVAREYAL